MGEVEERRVATLVAGRLAAMGLEAQLLPGGRCVRARLRLRPVPLPLPGGPRVFETLVFATVGATQLKCLEPAPLFQLPLVSIAGCTSAQMIEDRVRAALVAQGRALREAARALHALGVEARLEPETRSLAFGIGVEDRAASGRCLDATRIALPSRGPLSGVALARARERVTTRPAGLTSASDLEIALTNHLERLARVEQAPRATPVGSGHRVLLVGPLLGRDTELVQGLRRLGHRTRIEYSIDDALAAFSAQSFELVLVDTHVGRAEGLELVPRLAEIPGIERLPVVLVDERARESAREAARRAGAAGYLAHPLEASRIAAGLGRLLHGRGRRRFARVGRRLDVQGSDVERGFTISISRLGLSLRTPRELRAGGLQRWTIRLPELGQSLRVDAQTVYRIPAAGIEDPTAGLRIRSFPDRNEPLWIEYVSALAGPPSEAAR